MNKIFAAILTISLLAVNAEAKKIKFDYSVVNVPEEGGVNFERITDDADCVLYTVNNRTGIFGKKKASGVDWWVNPQIAISPDGQKIAYINLKNGTQNIMVKNAKKGGASVQRTFRTARTSAGVPTVLLCVLLKYATDITAYILLMPSRDRWLNRFQEVMTMTMEVFFPAMEIPFSSTVERDFSHTAYGAMTARPTFFPTILVA